MSNPSFLAFLPDPFGVRASHYCLCSTAGAPRTVSAKEVSEFKELLITFESAALVDELRRADLAPPTKLADAMDAQRLCIGVPRDEGGEHQWDIWANLIPRFSKTDRGRLFKKIFLSRHERLEDADQVALLGEAALALVQLWNVIVGQLAKSNNLERFMTLEAAVHGIFAYRQFAGVRIDREKSKVLIRNIADEKYDAYHRVAVAIQKNPTGLNFWNVGPHLAKTDMSHLSGTENGGWLRDAFKLAAFRSQFAKDFVTYVAAARDEAILRHTAGSSDRIHPVFKPLGTVTGRILVSDPSLQQLRRKYRGILAADPGCELRYLDYSQFEPGIVAFLSQDTGLIRAYNEGDVYLALSELVFGRKDHDSRSLSKKIYLAFCYGMTAEGIAKLIFGTASELEKANAFRDAISAFFTAFQGLNRLRAESEQELAKNGCVFSLWGNPRYRRREGVLDAKERRWALNQRVQATASLIFKEALAALCEAFGRQAILLPVHDAVLMQFKTDAETTHRVRLAVEIMEKAFIRRCPGIIARVTDGPFASE